MHGYEPVPVSGVENAAYYYSTYNAPDAVPVSDRRKIMVLGGGPNRIGQGIEFDYCCVHAAFALRDAGFESIMVNCNPETVSTDYDTSDKLYFEPLTVEDVLAIYEKERPEGVIVQFGGQTPLNIARRAGGGGRAHHRHVARHHRPGRGPRPLPQHDGTLGIPMPESGMATTLGRGPRGRGAHRLPAHACGPATCSAAGAWRSSTTRRCCASYVAAAVDVTPERPILIDKFLENALECEADALSDGTDAFVPAVMEHIEYAGVHSGDSACVIPPVTIPAEHLATIERVHQAHRHRAGRGRAHEHAVRHLRTTWSTSWRPTPGPRAPCRWSPRSATSRWPRWPPS